MCVYLLTRIYIHTYIRTYNRAKSSNNEKQKSSLSKRIVYAQHPHTHTRIPKFLPFFPPSQKIIDNDIQKIIIQDLQEKSMHGSPKKKKSKIKQESWCSKQTDLSPLHPSSPKTRLVSTQRGEGRKEERDSPASSHILSSSRSQLSRSSMLLSIESG